MMTAICVVALMSQALICTPEMQSAAETQAAIDLALPLIRRYEGLRLRTYHDPRPGDPISTIGYGHTGPDVRPGMRITREQAEDLLRLDAAAAAHVVDQAIRVKITPQQRAALISLAFNIGGNKFIDCAVVRAINRRDFVHAARMLLRYCHAGKPPKVLPGLKLRREAEVRLFEGGHYVSR